MLLLRTFCTIGKVSTTFLSRVMVFAKSPFSHGAKNSFLRFSRKLSILALILLHSIYINVHIAHILLYRKTLSDLQGPSYEFRKMTLFAYVKKWFFAIFSKSKGFSIYVASQHLYKCGYCAHFGVSEMFLRPSWANFIFSRYHLKRAWPP